MLRPPHPEGGLGAVRGRIIGLKYLNPGNAPDDWERQQLEAFTRGEKHLEDRSPPGLLLEPFFQRQAFDELHGEENAAVRQADGARRLGQDGDGARLVALADDGEAVAPGQRRVTRRDPQRLGDAEAAGIEQGQDGRVAGQNPFRGVASRQLVGCGEVGGGGAALRLRREAAELIAGTAARKAAFSSAVSGPSGRRANVDIISRQRSATSSFVAPKEMMADPKPEHSGSEN